MTLNLNSLYFGYDFLNNKSDFFGGFNVFFKISLKGSPIKVKSFIFNVQQDLNSKVDNFIFILRSFYQFNEFTMDK